MMDEGTEKYINDFVDAMQNQINDDYDEFQGQSVQNHKFNLILQNEEGDLEEVPATLVIPVGKNVPDFEKKNLFVKLLREAMQKAVQSFTFQPDFAKDIEDIFMNHLYEEINMLREKIYRLEQQNADIKAAYQRQDQYIKDILAGKAENGVTIVDFDGQGELSLAEDSGQLSVIEDTQIEQELDVEHHLNKKTYKSLKDFRKQKGYK